MFFMYAKETTTRTTTQLTEAHGRTRKNESSSAAANDKQTARRTRNDRAPQTERNYRGTV